MIAPRQSNLGQPAVSGESQEGWTLTQRPVRPEDGPLWHELVRQMSWATRYKRGSRRAEDLTPEDVRRAVTPDAENEIVFVVVASRGEEARMIGIARARRTRPDTWEFGIVVLDEWQSRGIGVSLMQSLTRALQERQAQRIEGEVLATNGNMLDFLQRLGFEAHSHQPNPYLKRMVRTLVPEPGRDGARTPESKTGPE